MVSKQPRSLFSSSSCSPQKSKPKTSLHTNDHGAEAILDWTIYFTQLQMWLIVSLEDSTDGTYKKNIRECRYKDCGSRSCVHTTTTTITTPQLQASWGLLRDASQSMSLH